MQCILVDHPTLGFQHNGYSHMRGNIFISKYIQIPRSGYRPECIAFTKTSITHIK